MEVNQLLPIIKNKTGEYLTKDPIFVDWLDNTTFKTDSYIAPLKKKRKKLHKDYPKLCEASVQSALNFCIETARSNGLEVLYLDLTKVDVGLPVVKVIAPGLRHFWRRTAPGRLYDVPVKMGWLEKSLKENELNEKSIFI